MLPDPVRLTSPDVPPYVGPDRRGVKLRARDIPQWMEVDIVERDSEVVGERLSESQLA